MSTADESHHEPAGIHDETAAKVGAHDDHGHDDHGHEVAADFMPESSGLDRLLQFIVVPLAGLGLILMMYMWASTPIKAEANDESGHGMEHALPVVSPEPAH